MTTHPPNQPAPAPSVTYTELPDFDTVEQHIYGALPPIHHADMLEPIHNLIRDAIDVQRGGEKKWSLKSTNKLKILNYLKSLLQQQPEKYSWVKTNG